MRKLTGVNFPQKTKLDDMLRYTPSSNASTCALLIEYFFK